MQCSYGGEILTHALILSTVVFCPQRPAAQSPGGSALKSPATSPSALWFLAIENEKMDVMGRMVAEFRDVEDSVCKWAHTRTHAHMHTCVNSAALTCAPALSEAHPTSCAWTLDPAY